MTITKEEYLNVCAQLKSLFPKFVEYQKKLYETEVFKKHPDQFVTALVEYNHLDRLETIINNANAGKGE